jgi:hypothetical protein
LASPQRGLTSPRGAVIRRRAFLGRAVGATRFARPTLDDIIQAPWRTRRDLAATLVSQPHA